MGRCNAGQQPGLLGLDRSGISMDPAGRMAYRHGQNGFRFIFAFIDRVNLLSLYGSWNMVHFNIIHGIIWFMG